MKVLSLVERYGLPNGQRVASLVAHERLENVTYSSESPVARKRLQKLTTEIPPQKR